MEQAANKLEKEPTLTLVIPVYNESANVEKFFSCLETAIGCASQVIIVDGGSDDGTYQKLESNISASSFSNITSLYQSAPGRAKQMNFGARKNTSDVIIFLHFDTCLPDNALELVRESIKNGAFWGRFDVRLDNEQPVFRVIENLMNLRSAMTSIATGDQGIFVRADIFRIVNGFPDIPLMEDIELSKNLKELAPADRIKSRATTSARRWQTNGVWKTIALMWFFRLAFWLGINPARLARFYRHVNQE